MVSNTMILRKIVLVFGLVIFMQMLYNFIGSTQETRWTVVPFLDIRVNSTHSLHGEQVPMLLKSQELHSQLRNGNSPNVAQMAQSTVNAASRVAGAIAAALPQWPSIKATANEDMHNTQNESTSEIGPLKEAKAIEEGEKAELGTPAEESGKEPGEAEKELDLGPLPAVEPETQQLETKNPEQGEPLNAGGLEQKLGVVPSGKPEVQSGASGAQGVGPIPEKTPIVRQNPANGVPGRGRANGTERAKAGAKGLGATEEKEDHMTYRHAKRTSEQEAMFLMHGTKILGRMTIVMMGYAEDRKENYRRLLSRYRSMCGLVSKIIVVWNNQKAEPPVVPAARHGTLCDVPVEIVRSKKNSLNNRFLVANLVQTEAVFSVDDDFLFSQSMLRCLLRHWERDKDRIVGLHPRLVEISGTYNPEYLGGYNLMLTGSAMFHARFLPLYAKDLEVQAKVDSLMSGEDILFNAISQNATGKAPLFVVPYENFRFKEFKKSSASGLHSRYTWKEWLRERSEIAIWAQEHFSKTVFQLETKKGLCMGHQKSHVKRNDRK